MVSKKFLQKGEKTTMTFNYNWYFAAVVTDIVKGYCEYHPELNFPRLSSAIAAYILSDYLSDEIIAAELECTAEEVKKYICTMEKLSSFRQFSVAIADISYEIPVLTTGKLKAFAENSLRKLRKICSSADFDSLSRNYMKLGVNPLVLSEYSPEATFRYISEIFKHHSELTDGEYDMLYQIIDYLLKYRDIGLDFVVWDDEYDMLLRQLTDDDGFVNKSEIEKAESDFLETLNTEQLIACLIAHHKAEFRDRSLLIESLRDGALCRIYKALLNKLS